MFDILKVELSNFRSYKGEHTFKLPTLAGLYCLTGENRVNPRLGANATGKSTLLDAIYWCFYGKTTRGLKSGDVITWGEHTCSVTVNLRVGDQVACIKRQQAPNSLFIEYGDKGHPCDQDEIQKFLRLGPDAFTHAVMLPQFGDSFFDLSPSDKLTLFAQIMGLDVWLEKSKQAADLATTLLADKHRAEVKLGKLAGQQSQIQADLERLTTLREQFDAEQEAVITKLEKDLSEQDKLERGEATQLKTARVALLGAQGRVVSATEAIKAAGARQVAAQGRREALGAARAAAGRDLKHLEGQLAQLTGLGSVCPTCLQTVDQKHLKDELARLKKQQGVAQSKLDTLDDELDEASKALGKAEADGSKAAAALQAISQNHDDFTREVETLERKKGIRGKLSQMLKANISTEINRPNPHTKQLAEKAKDATKLIRDKAQLKKDIDMINEDHVAVSYWVNGFKKIRLFIIEETLRQLELEINNNLGSLGLVDWGIALDVERENKSGGVTKGFTVLVQAPGHGTPVRFEAWSGGETQRLRLAGDLGLANLIMHRTGLTSTIEFFDEPSRHLSQEGLLDVAETLYQRAVDTNRRIFLVDHNNIDFGDFAGRFIAVKSKKGSWIETDTQA